MKNNCLFNQLLLNQDKLKYFIKDLVTKMGSVDSLCSNNIDLDLQNYLTMSDSGTIIKLQGREKEEFIQKQLNKKLASDQVNRLQPAAANQHTGFLYKKGVFFYEGHISGFSIMEESGKIVLLQKNIEFSGKFKDNQPHGEGTLTKITTGMTIKGRWKDGFPKRINFQNEGQVYIMEIESREGQPQQFPAKMKASLIYPDERRYSGSLIFKDGKYQVTGEGTLRYPNGDTLQGEFEDGVLSGHGVFRSKRGNYEGEFKHGKFNGRGQFFYPDDKVLKIFWIDNKPDGKGMLLFNRTDLEPLEYDILYQKGKRVLSKESIIEA